jgi:predicted Kef-type K+ transport protein
MPELVLIGACLSALASYVVFLKALMERAPLLENADVPESEA